MSATAGPGFPAAALDWRAAAAELEGAYTRRTLDTLLSHFGLFEAWCRARGVAALPAEAATVAAHVGDIYARMTWNTVATRRWAIRRLHGLLDLPDPTRGRAVELALRREVRGRGHQVAQAAPVTIGMKARILAAAPPTLRGLRDRLMIDMAYDTLCRPAELVQLRVEDVVPAEAGTARVAVRRAKNDPLGRGDVAFLSAATVGELEAWLAATGLTRGPILRQVRFSVALGQALTGQVVGRRLRDLAAAAGLPDAARLSGNSLRVGAAQDLAMAGCSLLEIMRAGRWQDPRTVSRYARRAPVNVWAVVEPTRSPAGEGFRRGPVVRPVNRRPADRRGHNDEG